MLDELRERPPELLEQRHPLALAARYGVERVFHAGRELVVDVLREELGQEAIDDATDVRRNEASILHLDVLAIAQRRDDRGVRRRPADAVLFERFDERGFRIARRRLREVLRALQVLQAQPIAFGDGGQDSILLVGDAVVVAFLIHRDEAGAHEHRARGAERNAAVGRLAGGEIERDRVVHGRVHLRRDGAFPDQLVELELIRIEELAHVLGVTRGRRRPNRFVRFLRVLRLGGVTPRLVRQIVGAETLGDDAADLGQRLVGERHGVRAHVADETDGAFADVDPFIETLRDGHRALRAEAELARRFLLQRGGRERRGRVAAALLLVDLWRP